MTPMTPTSHLAPALAIVGPANSGKTTLLHLLDRELQERSDRPLAYVLKGNPDGTGRYLYEAPHLRESLKSRVKGTWQPETVESICRWIDHCRASLELVLVDFGGRHDPDNDRMLSRCSHFVVVVRDADDAPPEHGDLASWEEVCRANGLAPVARLRSLWDEGRPGIRQSDDGVLEGAFRSDARTPGDRTNQPVISALADTLSTLRHPRPAPPYLDLHTRTRWRVEDLRELAPDGGALGSRLETTVRSGGPLVLGGRAPVWAHAAALHRALDLDPEALVLLFDPKLAWNLVEIPRTLAPEAGSELDRRLSVHWRPGPGGAGATLEVEITTPDRFLPLPSALDLARAPIPDPPPDETPPPGPWVVSGAFPIWLHLAYSRWLRNRATPPESPTSPRPIGHWDAATGRAVLVHGPGAPRAEPWTVEGGTGPVVS